MLHTEEPQSPIATLPPDDAAPQPVHFSAPPASFDSSSIFLGETGIRAGWSIAIFIAIFVPCLVVALMPVSLFLPQSKGLAPTATTMFFNELSFVAALAATLAIMAFIEHRPILDFNLSNRRILPNFLSGAAVGFLGVSALVGTMTAGGWIHFGSMASHGTQIALHAVEWAAAFLLVGCFEEGIFRGYLQFTLTRGLNFWCALAIEAALCLFLFLLGKGEGRTAIYLIALLGIAPCLILHLKKAKHSGFWFAAWVSSTLFGAIHTGNTGENWIGIFATAAVGFIFCVSLRLTGSAWWAIGCHSAWDWTQTFFYGTADSGIPAQGHLFTTTPAGSALLSGGTAGPEGSLLVIPTTLLMLALVFLLYGRKKVESSLEA